MVGNVSEWTRFPLIARAPAEACGGGNSADAIRKVA